jgi:hypothetical protein
MPSPGWEYMEVMTGDYGRKPQRVNGAELPDWKNQPDIVDYLQQLGSQRWELVAVMVKKQNPNDSDRVFYLKRPRT